MRRIRNGWLPHAVVAALAGAGIAWFGPPGIDLAAHVYQRTFFVEHGFQLWNNYWYAGRYSFVGYSLLYYPLAALIGIKLLAVGTASLSAAAFSVLVAREWPDAGRWPAWTFTAITPLGILTGAYPYALGLSLALVALTALRVRRTVLFAIATVLSFAASPLAFVLLFLVLLAATAVSRFRIAPTIVVALVGSAGAILQRLFPDGGRFPFPPAELGAVLVFCTLGFGFTLRVPAARLLNRFFAVYAFASLLAFAVPTAVGENIARLRFVALPLAVLALALRRWRPVVPAACALLLAGAWNITPLAFGAARAGADPSANAAYWTPAIHFLRGRVEPGFRVEAVDTAGHWEAVYLPQAGIPIVRGWFRQEDFPTNALLYRRLRSVPYERWLHRLGVKYVVLTDAQPDYSAKREALLLRGGVLPLVFEANGIRIYEVPDASSIAPGAHVLRLTPEGVTLALPHNGTYALSVRYSPYWHPSAGCVTRAADGMTILTAPRGTVRLRFAVNADSLVAAGTGSSSACAS
ncbi:MAG TPA: hypothetical protein VFJ78_05670 [Gaiellaceae bacterium]|nr:hypothetical protein [Gaiellaceae bacterium]